MQVIDGSLGEGGGQIFRTALTVALCAGKPVKIINIRAGRRKPGLLRQHLACLNAAKAISSARVMGDALGSQEVEFEPGEVQPGEYHFAVGSAGSTTLIFQTVFLPLALAGSESRVSFEGGTHNKMAPSFDFIQLSFLPLVERLGFRVTVELSDYGFYPAGGGKWCAVIKPAEAGHGLNLCEQPEVLALEAVATAANIPQHINERELAIIRNKSQWGEQAQFKKVMVESAGPGNILSLRINFGDYWAVFESHGERGRSAEAVGKSALKSMNSFMTSRSPVCEYLADQLLLPMVFSGGGKFVTNIASEHLITQVNIIYQLLEKTISITSNTVATLNVGDNYMVSVV